MAEGPHIKFGRNIRQHRERKGWNATEAAKKMEVARTALSRWENGHELPRGRSMLKLRDHLGIQLERDDGSQHLLAQMELAFDQPAALELEVTRKGQGLVQLEVRLSTRSG